MGKQHTVELTTRDGHVLSFECHEQESLLVGAERNGITLPAICRGGSCGACRARCTDGGYRASEHSMAALPNDAVERGEVLLCSTFPRTPLRIVVDQDRAAIQAGPIPERTATVAEVHPVGGGVVRLALTLEPDDHGNAAATFEPGQYMELSPPGQGFTRAYSPINTPNWEGRLEFYIRLQPQGKFSGWLRQARPGAPVRVRGPSGSFKLDETSLGARWFVAGGTGLAPILSMLRWMGELQAMQPVRLYFGVHDQSQLFALEELEELRSQLPGLKLETCLWHPGEPWQGFIGTPAEALARDLDAALAQGAKPSIYVCGPPGLVDAVEQLVNPLGLGAKLHAERFLPS